MLLPLKQGLPFSYRPYDCRTQKFREPVWVEPDTVAVVEGSYSCHPELWDFYDLHIFLTVSPEEQRLRIPAGGMGKRVWKSFKTNGSRWRSGILKRFG